MTVALATKSLNQRCKFLMYRGFCLGTNLINTVHVLTFDDIRPNYFDFPFTCSFVVIVFQLLDDDCSGCLDRTEIREAFDAVLQMTLTDSEFDAAVGNMKKNVDDGSITFQEFRKYFKHSKKRKEEILKRRESGDVGDRQSTG